MCEVMLNEHARRPAEATTGHATRVLHKRKGILADEIATIKALDENRRAKLR